MRFLRSAGAALASAVVAVLLGSTTTAVAQEPPPGETPGLALEARPRWQASTNPGTWTAYQIRVRNDGPYQVEGDVFLVPEAAPSRSGGRGRLGSRQRRSLEALPAGHVVTIGNVEVTRPVAPPTAGPASQEPSAPTSTPPSSYPTYRSPVTLVPGGSEKSLTMMVVEAPYGYRGEVRDRAGRTIAVSAPSYRPSVAGEDLPATIALLSHDAGGAEPDRLVRSFSPRTAELTVVGSAAEVPDDALVFSGLKALVVANFDLAALSERQLRALRDYVALGGSLVLAGGADGGRTLRQLPEELVPLPPTGTATTSLAALAEFGNATTEASATVVTGQLRRGRVVVHGDDDVPLVVQAEYGAGRVVQLAYDPLAEPFASDPLLQDLAWDQGLARAQPGFGLEVVRRNVVSDIGSSNTGVSLGTAPLGDQLLGQQLWSPPVEDRGWPSWPLAALGLLVAYVVVAFPLAHLVLRGRRRQRLMWRVAPLAAVVVAAVACVAGGLRSGPGHVVALDMVAPGGAVLASSYEEFMGLGRRQRAVALARGAAGSTVLAPAQLVAPTRRPTVPVAPGATAGPGTVTYGTPRPEVSFDEEPGARRSLQRLSLDQRPGLESRLRIVGSGQAQSGGLRIAGSVVNRSPTPIRRLRAQLPEGAQARLAEVIGPGESLEVDAPLVWPQSAPAGSTEQAHPEELLMYAAGAKAFTRSGQAAVVGIGSESSAGGAGAGDHTTVVVEVVALEASEAIVALTDGAQLVSEVSAPPTERVSIYELGGLAGIGGVHLAYQAVVVAEVYDWSSRTWRTLPPHVSGTHASEPLSDSEVNAGLVRVRVVQDEAAINQINAGLAPDVALQLELPSQEETG